MTHWIDNQVTPLEQVLEFAPVAIGVFDSSSKETLLLNNAFRTTFGYSPEDIPSMDSWYEKSFLLSDAQQQTFQPWLSDIESLPTANEPATNLETQILANDGSAHHVSLSLTCFDGKMLFYINDVTDSAIVKQRLQARSDMLEMVAKSSSLKDVLTVIVQQVQRESPQSLCSVLLFDKETQRLLLGAAPDLPAFYSQAIHGVHIGPTVGSCGAAAYYKQRVIVEDISTHPNWSAFTDLTQAAELTSCWSEPIISSDGLLLGTFAIYNAPSAKPTDKDIEQIQFASNLASIAIENHNAHQELERRANFDYLTDLSNRRSFFELSNAMLKQASIEKKSCALLMMDVDHFKKINDRYGHDLGDLVLKQLAKNSLFNLPNEAVIGRIGGEEFAIFLPNTGQAEAFNIAESLRVFLSSEALVRQGEEDIYYTVSLGVTFSSGPHPYTDELLREADIALYKAKQTGRNRVCLFNGC